MDQTCSIFEGSVRRLQKIGVRKLLSSGGEHLIDLVYVSVPGIWKFARKNFRLP
jgi:hypothetical protein